jgi:hypothetical protein
MEMNGHRDRPLPRCRFVSSSGTCHYSRQSTHARSRIGGVSPDRTRPASAVIARFQAGSVDLLARQDALVKRANPRRHVFVAKDIGKAPATFAAHTLSQIGIGH